MKKISTESNADVNCSVCFWNWNSDITENGILSQMKDFADGRIYGVIIHARAGLKIPYMGKRWMELFKYAVETAKELGLEVWVYDEDGWPSGFASGRVTALGEEYWFKRLHYVFAGSERLDDIECDNIVAVYQKQGEKYQLTDKYSLEALPEDAVVFWYSVDKQYVDLLNPKVTKAFISSTHERYKAVIGEHFGTVVKGFFTDEPQMNTQGYVWSRTLVNEYKNKFGRELIEDLWMIAVNCKDAHIFRYNLWSIIADLYFNNFVKQLTDWCEDNNLKLTGHFPAEDGLVAQIPACGEIMRNYSVVQFPAIDHLGSRVASPILMKQVSSVSRQYRDGNVLSETFGCAGWGVTFRRLQWIWGGQSVLGVTKPCYHLSAYSMEGRRKRDYPAYFSYQEPWWEDFKSFALWMKNFNALMCEGKRELHTLVIPPVNGMKYLYEDDYNRTGAAVELSSNYRCLVENLLDLQLDFDLGDEGLICNDAVVENGKITIGNISYDTVILSKTPVITKKLFAILKEFVRLGGTLLVSDRTPEYFTDGEKCDFSGLTKQVIANRRNTIEKHIEYMGLYRPVTVARTDNLKPISNVTIHTRITSKGRIVHIWPNEDFLSGNAYLRFGMAAIPYKVNVMDNTKEPLVRLDGKNDYLVPISINREENLVIELINDDSEGKSTNEYSLNTVKGIRAFDISTCDKNSLTIDRAAISMDGGQSFGQPQQILKILDSLYSGNRTNVLSVVLRYRFNCDDEVDFSGMTLALEDGGCYAVKVNDHPVSGMRKNWWIDECIGEYSIEKFVKVGDNFVDLYYEVPPICNDKDLLNIFETEINRFYYPIEPDSVYIRGNFDVEVDGEIYDNGFCYQTEGQFRLVKSNPKKIGDLTSQGMWFYRGNVSYKFTFDVEEKSQRILLTIDNYNGIMVALNINGKRLISHSCPATFDITDIVECGENAAELQLIGHNRNLLGPHHYVNGESYMVCPATFEGRWDGLAEFLSPWNFGKETTKVDEYGFIKFGLNDVKLEIYDKK